MAPRYQRDNPRTAENLEGEDTLPKADTDEISSLFSFLGIEEDAGSVLDGEKADLELWARVDQEYSSYYPTRVMSNEPVQGVLELTVDYAGGRETYLGRIEAGAQDIFSLDHMSSYEENDSEEINVKESYEENEEAEAD